MPKAFAETPEQRQKRRSVVRVLTRLSTALASPDVLSKDAGAAILGHRVGQLREVLDGEELELLDAQVQLYEEATGVPLPIPAPLPPVPPLPTRPSKAAGSQSRFRVHASDLQLTCFTGLALCSYTECCGLGGWVGLSGWMRYSASAVRDRFALIRKVCKL